MAGTRSEAAEIAARAAAATILVALVLGCSDPDSPEPESAAVTSGAPSPGTPSTGGEAAEDGPDAALAADTVEKAPSGAAAFVDDGPESGSNPTPDSEAAAEPSAGAPVETDPEFALKPPAGAPVEPDPEFALKPPAGAPVEPDSEFALKPSAEDPADADPEFAVEIVEELAPTEPAGGARQEEPLAPVESGGSHGTGASGRETTTSGETYTWHDGDRVLEAVLQPGLTVINEGPVGPGQDVVADTGQGRIVTRGAEDAPGVEEASGEQGAEGTPSVQPVFLSESGELMTLPGGVILVLDEDWDSDATDSFFARNGISLDRVSELDYVVNGFLIDTEPGFPSLELANALAAQSGVELSSPNWSRERTTR